MTDSSLNMSTASFVSSQQSGESHHTADSSNNSMYSSLPSLPSLPPIDIDARFQHSSPLSSATSPHTTSSSQSSIDRGAYIRDDDDPSLKSTARPPWRQLMWGHIRSVSSVLARNMFKDNNLPLILNMIGHFLAARQLWGKSSVSVARYTSAQPSSGAATVMTDQFRTIGVLHMTLGLLAGLALKERRLSTERTTLWVLAVAAWTQSLVQGKAYLQSPTLYTLRALQEWGTLNGVLTLITSIALRNTVRRTGRLF